MQEAITTSPASSPTTEEVDSVDPAIRIRDLDFLYGSNQVIHNVSLDIFPKEVWHSSAHPDVAKVPYCAASTA